MGYTENQAGCKPALAQSNSARHCLNLYSTYIYNSLHFKTTSRRLEGGHIHICMYMTGGLKSSVPNEKFGQI